MAPDYGTLPDMSGTTQAIDVYTKSTTDATTATTALAASVGDGTSGSSLNDVMKGLRDNVVNSSVAFDAAAKIVSDADSAYNKHVDLLSSIKKQLDALDPAASDYAEKQATLTRAYILQNDALGNMTQTEDAATKAKTAHLDALTRITDKLTDSIAETVALTAAVGKGGDASLVVTATYKAQADALAAGLIPGTTKYADAVTNLTALQLQQVRATADLSLANKTLADNDQATLYNAETAALGMASDERDKYITHLTAELAVKRQFPNADQAMIDGYLKSVDAMEQSKLAMDQQKQSLQELSSLFTQSFDSISQAITNSLLQGTGAAVNWRNVMVSAAQQVLDQFLKLALLNPVLNSLFGQSNATISSVAAAVTGSGSTTAGTTGTGTATGGGSSLASSGNLLSAGGLLTHLLPDNVLQSLGLSGSNGIFGGVSSVLSTPVFTTGATPGLSLADAAAQAGAGNLGGLDAALGSAGTTTTLGGLLGPAGLGFGAGELANSLLGGKTTGGTIGSGVGSLAGAAIGSIVPGVGTLLGALFGGAIGRTKGGIIGRTTCVKGLAA
jgi:hypothetical protein